MRRVSTELKRYWINGRGVRGRGHGHVVRRSWSPVVIAPSPPFSFRRSPEGTLQVACRRRRHAMVPSTDPRVKRFGTRTAADAAGRREIPVLGIQLADDVSHKPGGRLPLLPRSYPRNP